MFGGSGKGIRPKLFMCTRKVPLHTPARPVLRNNRMHDDERHRFWFSVFTVAQLPRLGLWEVSSEVSLRGLPQRCPREVCLSDIPKRSQSEMSSGGVSQWGVSERCPCEVCLSDVPQRCPLEVSLRGVPGRCVSVMSLRGVPERSPSEVSLGGVSQWCPSEVSLRGLPQICPWEVCLSDVPQRCPWEVCLSDVPQRCPWEVCLSDVPQSSHSEVSLRGVSQWCPYERSPSETNWDHCGTSPALMTDTDPTNCQVTSVKRRKTGSTATPPLDVTSLDDELHSTQTADDVDDDLCSEMTETSQV